MILRAPLIIILFWLSTAQSQAQIQQFANIHRLNRQLAGHVDDYTKNHCRFRRIKSELLGARRDLYVYTPPGYCRRRSYPLVLWLHGAFGDEHAFFRSAQIKHLDQQIRCGHLPPMIVVCPDGTCTGRNFITTKHSFFVNSERCGCFEDYLMNEIMPFVVGRYSIAPDRNRRAVVGVSGGGMGAMNLAIRYRECFGSVATLSGALNLRYYNTCQDYARDFDPLTFRWREQWDAKESIGKMGPLSLKAGTFITPVFGDDQCTLDRIKRDNPADVLLRSDVGPGQLNMLVSYGCKDEFNFDSQGASFVWLARQMGLDVDVMTDPEGEHGKDFFLPMQSRVYEWLGEKFR